MGKSTILVAGVALVAIAAVYFVSKRQSVVVAPPIVPQKPAGPGWVDTVVTLTNTGVNAYNSIFGNHQGGNR